MLLGSDRNEPTAIKPCCGGKQRSGFNDSENYLDSASPFY